MRNLIRYVLSAGIFSILTFSLSCKKDSLSKHDTAAQNMVVFEDDSIALPIAVAAGDNCLLSAYNTISGDLKFNLTDNNGKLIWQKQFEIQSIGKIIWEPDGTFAIFPGGKRIININKEGTVVRDDPEFMDSLYVSSGQIFNAFIDKSNNYIITGMYGLGTYGIHRAFASAYTHEGEFIFQKEYIDSSYIPNSVTLGNYSAITGCEFMDDGGYIFFGNAYYAYFHDFHNQVRFQVVRTDRLGNILWHKNNLLIDSSLIKGVNMSPPFTNQLPYNMDIYGFHPESFTHEIMKTADGNYLCFLNTPDYLATDQSARIYKFDEDGNMLDSAAINFGIYNRYMGGLSNYYRYTNAIRSYSCGDGVVKNADNTFTICLQNGFFAAKGLTTSYLGDNRSFLVRIDQDMNVLDARYIQNYYTDCFNSICKTSDGRTACFGLISSFGNTNKPAMLIYQ